MNPIKDIKGEAVKIIPDCATIFLFSHFHLHSKFHFYNIKLGKILLPFFFFPGIVKKKTQYKTPYRKNLICSPPPLHTHTIPAKVTHDKFYIPLILNFFLFGTEIFIFFSQSESYVSFLRIFSSIFRHNLIEIFRFTITNCWHSEMVIFCNIFKETCF